MKRESTFINCYVINYVTKTGQGGKGGLEVNVKSMLLQYLRQSN